MGNGATGSQYVGAQLCNEVLLHPSSAAGCKAADSSHMRTRHTCVGTGRTGAHPCRPRQRSKAKEHNSSQERTRQRRLGEHRLTAHQLPRLLGRLGRLEGLQGTNGGNKLIDVKVCSFGA